MFLNYHWSDFRKVPSEDKVMDALGNFKIPPGDYSMPYAGNSKELNSPEFNEKLNKGPAALITVIKNGKQPMTGMMIQWFAFCLLVGIFSAYITGRALEPGANYLEVFRFVGFTAFVCHSFALLQNSIWYHRNWGATLKSMFDGLIYALLTAGTFGWLWPVL